MTSPPTTLRNPNTNETLTVEQTARTGAGESKLRFTLPPFQAGPPLHFHRRFTETIVVLEGELEVTVGSAGPRRIPAGERVSLPPGTRHSFRNTTDRPVTFRAEIDEGRGFERFICGWYGVATDGGSSSRGAPRNPLSLAVLLDEGDVCLAGPPLFAQLAVRRSLRWVAARVGVEARIAKWW